MRQPPAILVGANMVTAVSVIRSLARDGVDVRLLCRASAAPAYSRYAQRLPADGPGPAVQAWRECLLGPGSSALHGAVLLACNDDGVQFLLDQRDELAADYLLDVCEPGAQRAMLDKLATYRAAAAAGVPTPRFWPADTEEQLLAARDEYVYPLMVKPLLAHAFKRVFPGKYFMVDDFDELLATFRRCQAESIGVVLLEVIPGPDDLLCSYYTYLDEAGEPQFHFTKRIIRRYPEREGFGCYHITDWNPEVRDLGLRLFRHAGLRGVANVEFKRDQRDGQLKLIECNARFTAANALLVASGLDLGLYVYRRLAGLPQPAIGDVRYRTGLRLWYPFDDFLAFLELRRQGRLTLGGWLRDVCHPQVLPYFSPSDPLPSLVRLKNVSRPVVVQTVRDLSRRWSGHGA